MVSPYGMSLAKPHAARSTQTVRAQSASNALVSSRACQSARSVISATVGGESRASASPECGIEQIQIDVAGVKALAAFERGDDHGCRCEEHRIDRIEIPIETREDFREWPALIARAPARKLLGESA